MTTANDPSVAELVAELQRDLCMDASCTHPPCVRVKKAVSALTRLERRCAEMEKALRTLVFQPLAPRDHLTSCDKIMGATHPCTCHADEYRALLLPPERANDGKIGG